MLYYWRLLYSIIDSCVAMEYDVSPDTGLAVVEVPGLWGKTKLSLPPGHYPFYHIFSSGSCTVEYHVNGKYEQHVYVYRNFI